MYSHKFTFAKTTSWYVIHSIGMVAVGYVITGSIAIGLAFAMVETILEAMLYYIHERFWIRIGKKNANI